MQDHHVIHYLTAAAPPDILLIGMQGKLNMDERPGGKVRKKKNKLPPRPPTLLEIERHKRRTRRRTCSDSWTEAVVYHGAQYPPGGERTKMRTCACPRCEGKRWWPGVYIGSSGISYDCLLESMPAREWSQLPSSVSGMMIRQAALAKIKYPIRQTHLAPERRKHGR